MLIRSAATAAQLKNFSAETRSGKDELHVEVLVWAGTVVFDSNMDKIKAGSPKFDKKCGICAGWYCMNLCL